MTERAAQLIFEVHKGQSQFAYFQLGVAASAIAFAIHQTASTSLNDAPWPLGLAVALWALSFALGCFGLDARQRSLGINAAYLQAIGDIPAQLRTEKIVQAIDEFKEDVSREMERPGLRFRWQKWALFAGALAYIVGHIMQMVAIPPKAADSASSTAVAAKP